MAAPLETYRGVVNAWECDVVAHFTIAYYFDRFADATLNFFDLIGAGDCRQAVRLGPARSRASFEHELRAGDAFHILTAVAGLDGPALQLGHQVIDSSTRRTVTWFKETFPLPETLTESDREKLSAFCLPWAGPSTADHPPPQAANAPLTARDRVKPWEIGEDGTLSLAAQVLRFSAAAQQALAAAGMTPAYMQAERRGFSTFGLDLARVGKARTGDVIDVRTAISHLGKSSLRLAHRMTDAQGGEIAFLVQSGVHLSMDARRSAPIPDELRAAMEKLMVPDP